MYKEVFTFIVYEIPIGCRKQKLSLESWKAWKDNFNLRLNNLYF